MFWTSPAFADADSDFRAGLTYLEDSTNISFSSALTLFHSALSQDANHVGANVFAAMVEFGQFIDDTKIFTIRNKFSVNGMDSISLDQYVNAMDKDRNLEFDSMVDYRDYQWGTDPKPSDVQAVLKKIISDSIPHIESHLSAAVSAGGSIQFPRNIIDDAGSADTYEIDTTEILLMHSYLLCVKAAMVVLTSYDFDLTDTPDDIPDTISWTKFKSDHPKILSKNYNWDTAWSAIKDADTKFTLALNGLRSEGDAQDSDFIQRTAGDSGHIDRFINDTDLNEIDSWVTDTLADFFAGDSITTDTEEAYAEIGGIAIIPKEVFDDPPDRYDIGDLDIGPRDRGFEWNDVTWMDATLGGILPGMTLSKWFLFSHTPDTYFVVTSSQTIDLNSLYGSSTWVPRRIDILFSGGGSSVDVIRRRSSSDTAFWRVTLSPKTTGHHALMIYEDFNDDEDFFNFQPRETFKIRRVGDLQGPALRIVPWVSSAGIPGDAGSTTGNFSTYFNSVSVVHGWTLHDADTVQMFAMPNGENEFDSIPTSTLTDATNDTTHVVGAPTALGWFLAGSPATPSDSLIFRASTSWLTGDTGSTLSSDFYVYVSKFKAYKDTQYGYFSDAVEEALGGVTVTFSIIDFPSGATGYSIDTSSTVTDIYGLARTRLTLGNKAGIYVVRATLSADSGGGEVLLFGASTGAAYWTGERSALGPWYIFTPSRRPSTLTPSAVMAASTFASDEWKMYEYDATVDAYEVPTSLALGDAYWLKTLEDGTIDFSSASSLTDTQYIPLDAGWNLIGMPFEQVYPTRNLLVQTSTSIATTVTLDTAEDSGLLYNRFYSYNGTDYDACPDATDGRTNCYFYPWEGQWIRAISACTIVVPAPASYGFYAARLTSAQYRPPAGSAASKRSAVLLASPALGDGRPDWTVQLIAKAGKSADMSNLIGIRSDPDEPVFEAPRAPNGVSLAIMEGGERYSNLYRASTVEKPSWNFEVHSASAAVVTVSAANLTSVPSGVALTLTDAKTSEQTDLRASSGYSYISLPGESRSFTVSTEAPSLWSRLTSATVKYPAACVVTRTCGVHSVLATRLRNLRDLLLNTSVGRALTGLYYE